MKILVTMNYLILLICLSFCSSDESNPTDSTSSIDSLSIPGFELVWNDEFDYDGLPDTNMWDYDIGGHGWGNNELQHYTSDSINARVENGKLVIEAHHYPDLQIEYTSTRLITKNKGDWKYGRFDIMAKLPYGQGLWPAIWMLPTDWVYGGWAASGEIDIMEYLGHETDKVYGTLHYGGPFPNNVHSGTSYTLPTGTFAGGFHLFTLEWEKTEFRWYVDGKHYQTQNNWHTTNGNYPAPFNERFHLLLNVAVGGNWPGYPDQTTTFPQRMEVDYVRVYKIIE
jgi:beta-glucanase (GH16 family)